MTRSRFSLTSSHLTRLVLAASLTALWAGCGGETDGASQETPDTVASDTATDPEPDAEPDPEPDAEPDAPPVVTPDPLPTCTPGEERCLGSTQFACSPAGQWLVAASCAQSEHCGVDGECVPDPNAGECGDGALNTGELCEEALWTQDIPCTDLGPHYASGTVSCVDCALWLADCVLSDTCGDGVLDPGEGCDDGNILSDDGCASNCTSEEGLGAGQPCGNTGQSLFGLPTGAPDLFCDDPQNRDAHWPGDEMTVRVTVHVVRSTTGALAIDEPTLAADFEHARLEFAEAGVALGWDGWDAVDLLNDTDQRFYDLVLDDFWDLLQLNNDPTAVDVYVVNGFYACGLSGGVLWPDSPGDGVIVKAGCGGATLTHEIGHLFGLWHTHHDYIDDPDGDACDTLGDLCCDTPPDPGPKGGEGDSGSEIPCAQPVIDGCDDPLDCGETGASPDPYNTMSYYWCANSLEHGTFTPQQHGRLRCYLERNYGHALGDWPYTPHCEGDVLVYPDGVTQSCEEMGQVCVEGDDGAACVTPDCVPDCEAKICGDDGCGTSCGDCPHDGVCAGGTACYCTPGCAEEWTLEEDCSLGLNCATFSATCELDPDTGQPGCQEACIPDCTGQPCGDDGCGGSCGDCPYGGGCVGGACVCTPGCAGGWTLDNDCELGVNCATFGAECIVDPGTGAPACLSCVPDCTGQPCGDDGCGGSCGDCPYGGGCVGGACVCAPSCAGSWTVGLDCSLGVNCATFGANCEVDPDSGEPACQAP